MCEATLERGEDEAELRGHLSVDEAVATAERARTKRLLLTHRPQERSIPNGYELAYDGLELAI